MKLMIKMKSNNGIISAGHATFNLSKLKPSERNIYIKKNATITFDVEL